MIIEIKESDCKYLNRPSYYNHNYYQLPISINGCSVLYDECHDSLGSMELSIGEFVDEKYKPRYCFCPRYPGEYTFEVFILNSEDISTKPL